jgi:hypothetical protein
MNNMRLPGFTAEGSLAPTTRRNREKSYLTGLAPNRSGGVTPQFRIQVGPGVDLGSYLRCLENGGDDLTCRFFGGLPPFTIGGLLY